MIYFLLCISIALLAITVVLFFAMRKNIKLGRFAIISLILSVFIPALSVFSVGTTSNVIDNAYIPEARNFANDYDYYLTLCDTGETGVPQVDEAKLSFPINTNDYSFIEYFFSNYATIYLSEYDDGMYTFELMVTEDGYGPFVVSDFPISSNHADNVYTFNQYKDQAMVQLSILKDNINVVLSDNTQVIISYVCDILAVLIFISSLVIIIYYLVDKYKSKQHKDKAEINTEATRLQSNVDNSVTTPIPASAQENIVTSNVAHVAGEVKQETKIKVLEDLTGKGQAVETKNSAIQPNNNVTVMASANTNDSIITSNVVSLPDENSQQKTKTKSWDDLTEKEQKVYINIAIEYVYKTELKNEAETLTIQQKAFKQYCLDNSDYSVEDLDEEEKKIVKDFAISVYNHKRDKGENAERTTIERNTSSSNDESVKKTTTKGLKAKWNKLSKLAKAMIIVAGVFVIYAILWGVIPNILASNPNTIGAAISIGFVFAIIGYIFIFGVGVFESIGIGILIYRKHMRDLAKTLKGSK